MIVLNTPRKIVALLDLVTRSMTNDAGPDIPLSAGTLIEADDTGIGCRQSTCNWCPCLPGRRFTHIKAGAEDQNR